MSMTSNLLRAVPRSVALAALLAVMNPVGALATDLPLPMYTKAPPTPAVTPPYDWSGFYVGGHLGYLWGRTHVDDDGVTAERNAHTDGVVGGVMLGYNWQINRVVLGLEGDFGWTNAHGVGAETTDPGGGTGGSNAADDGGGTTTTLVPVITHAPNHYDVRWTSHRRSHRLCLR
jgi:opacity protein-like surface antigen